jgi:1,2-phenylacetyl-CoA epoxidase catalytic subunit
MSVATRPAATTDITYEDLYRRWEEGNWKATDLDFARDREGWNALTDVQRSSALWIYSMFFYGEDRVAEDLSPYIDAAPNEEQKYFLATQQVDEVRHAVFFHRFFKEVIGAGETIGDTLASTLPELNWGYRGVFDRLDVMAEELRHDRSLPKFAQAIALYHMVVEATLAQPGQHFIEDFFTKSGTMPGFSAGMKQVSRDEQRHIGFGVKTLSECFARSEECKAAVAEILGEVLPYSLTIFVPPNWDLRYTREYGFELEDIYAFGLRSVRAKWRAAGYPIEDMPAGVFPLDLELGEEEIARRQILLLRAGVTGEPGSPIAEPSPEVQRIYFDLVAEAVEKDAVERPMTIQWRFADADNWHVRIDNGSTRAEPGDASAYDVALETTWKDWIDVSMHGMEPWRAVLGRRLRPRGSLGNLRRMQRLFPRRPTFA